MAFFRKLKETQKQRRRKQIISGLFLIAAIVGIWLISKFAENKSLLYALDILAIVYFAFDIIAKTDYWQIKIWKSSKKGEAKMRERIEKDLEKELEKRRLAKEKQSSGVHDEIDVMKDNGKYAVFLPSFTDMDKDPSPEEIIRVAGLTETILHLTFKNPCPIEQDPVFQAVLNANTQSLMECLQSGKLNVGDHNELKQTFENKYSEKVAKAMIELDYWNMRMIEHAVLMKSLGPKPAYNCLSAVYSIIDIAPNACCILIVNYAHLLLKFSMLKISNPVAISDIKNVLNQASHWLDFDEGRNYSER